MSQVPDNQYTGDISQQNLELVSQGLSETPAGDDGRPGDRAHDAAANEAGA